MKRTLSLLLPLLCSTALHAQTESCSPLSSRINLASGAFSARPGVTFKLHQFSATLVPRGKTSPACFQKLMIVDHADIFVSNESLTSVFAEKICASRSKIRNLKVTNTADGGTLSGTVDKMKMPIDFSIQGPITTDGQYVTITAAKIKADGIPVKGLLSLIGEQLSSILVLGDVKGLIVGDNTLSFSPEKVANLKGNIASVQTSPEGLTLHYRRKPVSARARTVASLADTRPAPAPSPAAR